MHHIATAGRYIYLVINVSNIITPAHSTPPHCTTMKLFVSTPIGSATTVKIKCESILNKCYLHVQVLTLLVISALGAEQSNREKRGYLHGASTTLGFNGYGNYDGYNGYGYSAPVSYPGPVSYSNPIGYPASVVKSYVPSIGYSAPTSALSYSVPIGYPAPGVKSYNPAIGYSASVAPALSYSIANIGHDYGHSAPVIGNYAASPIGYSSGIGYGYSASSLAPANINNIFSSRGYGGYYPGRW